MTTRGGAQQIPRPAIFTTSDVPPWHLSATWTLDRLLATVPTVSAPLVPAFPNARLSAVLLLLADGADGPEVLLTRRSMLLRNHRGEISFPGGRVDDGESAIDTALREAHEEVGLDPSLPRIVGELSHLNTIVSRSYIVPVVAVLEPRLDDRGDDRPHLRPDLAPQNLEVDRILWTPISELTAAGNYRLERWGSPPMDRELHFFDLDDETVWGATAHMLVELLVRSTRTDEL